MQEFLLICGRFLIPAIYLHLVFRKRRSFWKTLIILLALSLFFFILWHLPHAHTEHVSCFMVEWICGFFLFERLFKGCAPRPQILIHLVTSETTVFLLGCCAEFTASLLSGGAHAPFPVHTAKLLVYLGGFGLFLLSLRLFYGKEPVFHSHTFQAAPLYPLMFVLMQAAFFLRLHVHRPHCSFFALAVLLFLFTAWLVPYCLSKLPENRIPSFARAQLMRQLTYLEKQNAQLKAIQEAIDQYKKNGDLSRSVDDIYAKGRTYFQSLYADNPVFHTMFAYYANRFEETGISWFFQVTCSTYFPCGEKEILCLLCSLLDLSEAEAKLRMGMNRNLCSIRFTTSASRKDDLCRLLDSFHSIPLPFYLTDSVSSDADNCTAEMHLLFPAS